MGVPSLNDLAVDGTLNTTNQSKFQELDEGNPASYTKRTRYSRELFCPLGLSYTVYYTMYMYTVFDLIGARGAYVNLFSTTSAKRSPSG